MINIYVFFYENGVFFYNFNVKLSFRVSKANKIIKDKKFVD